MTKSSLTRQEMRSLRRLDQIDRRICRILEKGLKGKKCLKGRIVIKFPRNIYKGKIAVRREKLR